MGDKAIKEKIMNYRKAVTLVELLVVLVILAALAYIAVPRIGSSAQNAKLRACQTNIDIMNSQIEIYAADHDGTYPSSLATVTGDGNYFPDGAPTCPSSGTYTMDSDTYRVSCSASGH